MSEKEKLNMLLNLKSEWYEEEEEEEEDETIEEEEEGEEKKKEEKKVEEEEENPDEFFSPFGKEKEEEEGKEKKEEEEKKVAPEIASNEDSEARAGLKAIDLVDEYLEEHEEFKDLKKTLREYTSKAVLKGIADPLEFALRNAQTPEYWINYGKKLGVKDAQVALNTRYGGSSARGSGDKTPDYENMSREDFMKDVNDVLSRRQ